MRALAVLLTLTAPTAAAENYIVPRACSALAIKYGIAAPKQPVVLSREHALMARDQIGGLDSSDDAVRRCRDAVARQWRF